MARQAAEHRKVVVAGGVKQHRRVARRRIGAGPVLGPGIEAFPGGDTRQGTYQGRGADVLHAGLAGAGVGHDGHDQAASLVVPSRLRQLAFGRIHHAVNLTRHDADGRFHARGTDLNVHKTEQVANMAVGAMPMQALETTNRPVVIGLEVGRAAVDFTGVFLHPGAGDVMFAVAQWCLVQATISQGDQHAVFFGAGYPDRVAIAGVLPCAAFGLPFRASLSRQLQLQTIDQFVNRIAQLGGPHNHPARERRHVFAVHGHREPGQPRSGAIGSRVAQPGGDDGIHQPVSGGAVRQRIAQQVPGLVIPRRCLQQPGRGQRQSLHRHLDANVIQHHGIEAREARLLPAVLARLVGPEYRQTEVVVGCGGQGSGLIRGPQPRLAKPDPGGSIGWVAVEADHHRPRVDQRVAEPGQQKLVVVDCVGFIASAGFLGAGRGKCQGRIHWRHL